MGFFPQPKTSKGKCKNAGFSLIELMIVVGIIGILATMAIPRFQSFQAKARMSEAKNTLSHIYTLQQSYHMDRGTYLNVNAAGYRVSQCGNNLQSSRELGLEFTPCVANSNPRYQYSTTSATQTAFIAMANTLTPNLVCGGENTAHNFTINQDRTLNFALGTSPATQWLTPRCK